MKVWYLIISNKRGEEVTIHATPEGADDELADYVRTAWNEEEDGTPPADRQEMIDSYFDMYLDEWYMTDVREVQN